MSRSRRKKPVFGYTSCSSEREDKKEWHKRWRRNERQALAILSPEDFEAYLSSLENDASNVWAMGKDGRVWRNREDLEKTAEWLAERKARSAKELAQLKKRFIHKLLGK